MSASPSRRRNAVALLKLHIPEETHEVMSKAAMQEHFISFIRGDVPIEAAEGEATKYGPAGKAVVGWKKDSRNDTAWKVMEGLSRDELVKVFNIVGGH